MKNLQCTLFKGAKLSVGKTWKYCLYEILIIALKCIFKYSTEAIYSLIIDVKPVLDWEKYD